MANKPTEWTNLESWKHHISGMTEGSTTPHVSLRKTFIPDEIKTVEGESRTLQFTISTDTPDRDRDTIDVAGWDLRAFKKNPVVLWAHDYSGLLVAKASSIKKEEGRLTAKATFAEHEFAETVSPFRRTRKSAKTIWFWDDRMTEGRP